MTSATGPTTSHVSRALRLSKGGPDMRDPSNAWFYEVSDAYRAVYLEGPHHEPVAAGLGLPYSFSVVHCV